MEQFDSVISRCREMLVDGAEVDTILRELRDAGCSKVQSIKALVELEQASLAEAKTLVHGSNVWDDVFERDSRFQEAAADAVIGVPGSVDED